MEEHKKKINDFVKIHHGYVQIYLNNIPKETKQTKKYLYIYRYNINKINYQINKQLEQQSKINIYEKDEFPEYLVLNTHGYMFIKNNSKKKNYDIPLLPKFPIYEYKTNFIDFNNMFNKNINSNTFIKLSPFVDYQETHPKIINEFDYLLNIEVNNEEKIDSIKEDFKMKIKELKIKNSKEWFNYIKENCPIHSVLNLPFNYYSEINNNTFKKEPNLKDVAIFYDIKSKHEYKIIKKIELTFEDHNQKVIFHETYNNKLKDVIKKCNEKKIKYIKKNDYSIELKWSDLNTLGLKWNITDFI